MDNGLNIAFIKLKSVCDSVAANPTKAKFNELKSVVNSLPDNIIQTLHEFILFPFYLSLHSEKLRNDTELKLILFETLHGILKRIKLEKVKLFTRLHIALVQQLFDKNSPTLVQNLDEDLKLNITLCLELMFKNASEELIFDLYDKENCFQLPQTCQICIQLAKNEKYRVLRMKAIECIMAIAHVHDEANFKNTELRKKIANIFMFILPGITIGLLDVAKGDIKQGHKVTSLAVKALNRLIVLHMQDEKNQVKKKIIFEYPLKEEDDDDVIVVKNEMKSVEDMRKRFESGSRSEQWYKETSTKLKTLLDMLNLQNHDHPKVRFEMVELCRDIVLLCPNNMASSLSNLIDILISLSEDSDPEVMRNSKDALSKILDGPSNLNISAEDIVQENLYNVLNKFPRIMNETDLTKKINILNLIIGYLRIMKNNLDDLLKLSSHLRRLLLSLIHVAQLERTHISLLEEHAVRDFEVESQSSITWKQFTYLDEKDLLTKFQLILRILSESTAIEIIIDHLCDLFNHGENRNEVIFILNELILGKFIDLENQKIIINRIFSMYMEENNWYLDLNVTKSSEDSEKNVTLQTVHNNVIQICLLVEGIGNMAIALQEDFKAFLFKALYSTLERAGSAQPLISAAGFLTLSNISKACGYKSVTDLIVDNTDYFSFHVTKKLKRLEQNPSVLEVLNVVMTYSTRDVLPPIMDIINKVLLQSCDKFQQHNATLFLKVFLSFISSLTRWYHIDMNPIDRHVKLLLEYKKTMDNLYNLYSFNNEELVDEPVPENLNEEHFKRYLEEDLPEEEHKKPEPPDYIKLTVSVLKRSLNFLPNKDRQRKLLVLDILKFGVKVISNFEDELLPIVHLIWSPFIGRFKETSDSLIVNKSFDLLIVLASTSTNFIRHRTSKSIFKDICSNLKKLAKESYLKDRGSAYRYTQDYKLQLSLLKNLAELITDLEMDYDDVKIAMESAIAYLSNKQPKPLQESALHFYKTLALYDFDSVWLFLIDIYGSKTSREQLIIKRENEQNLEAILKRLNLAKW